MKDEGIVPQPATPKCVAIYTRCACSTQRTESLEDQERNCRQYAEKHGWVVPDVFVYSDVGTSGLAQRRKGLNELLAQAQTTPRPFDLVIVNDALRIARSLQVAVNIAQILKRCGVDLAIADSVVDPDDPEFRNMLGPFAITSENYAAKLRQRIRRGLEGRVRSGFSPGGTCFGYRSASVNDDTRRGRAGVLGYRLVPIADEAAIVDEIFQLFADGQSSSQIATKLNQEQVSAPHRLATCPSGTTWTSRHVSGILKNQKYVGQLIWNKTSQARNPFTGKIVTRKNLPAAWILVHHPELRIVSDELWNRVQDRLRA